MSKLHDECEARQEVLPGASGEGERASAPEPVEALSIGDCVVMTGEVVNLSSVGDPWCIVRLDGERRHAVGCNVGDVTRVAQHKGDARPEGTER